jgi:phage major head subunit gpT-like protein
MVSVTRQDLVNDSLGALAGLPQLLAVGAMNNVEQVFWTLVLANAGSFYDAANNNFITDALDLAGLTSAISALRKQTDADGNPIIVSPRFLVVPPELEVVALDLVVRPDRVYQFLGFVYLGIFRYSATQIQGWKDAKSLCRSVV